MENGKKYLALDFGASSGRAIIGKYDGTRLKLEEMHRFENRPVFVRDTLYWDFLRLFSELKTGIVKADKKYNNISSLGVDTWGCDFGFLDRKQNLLSNPVHYRDKRTNNILRKVFEVIPEDILYNKTGLQAQEINSLYQLYSLKLSGSPDFKNAKYFLMIGDLFNFFLTGSINCEFTNAMTAQLLDIKEKKWDREILKKLSIPSGLFQEITSPGSFIGNLQKEICTELECAPIPVALPAYDTSSEISAIPISPDDYRRNYAYLNCGTWAMVGTITDSPIIKREGFLSGFGNEGGPEGKYHFLKNMVGLWIIQQCRKRWIEDGGNSISWDEIIDLTRDSRNTNTYIDTDDSVFEKELFNMPAAILKYCNKTGQKAPEGIGEMARCVFESFVLKYVLNIKRLEKITGRKIEVLHLVGGGSQNKLLCQWISDASGIPLIAGPVETTTFGNILLQMKAAGDINNIKEGREIVLNSVSLRHYEPTDPEKWDTKFDVFKDIINKDDNITI